MRDKLRHFKILRVYLAKIYWNQIPNQKCLGGLYWEELGEKSFTEEVEAKQGNNLLGYSLSGHFIWESPFGCLWWVVLRFWFLNLDALESQVLVRLRRLLRHRSHSNLKPPYLINLTSRIRATLNSSSCRFTFHC